EVGIVGGGSYEIHDLTVTTYDSAYIHLGNLGARFGLVIFDECHHLPSPSYAVSAKLSLAPFRLGLTATPERPDGRHVILDRVIGEVVYHKDIHDMAGEYLASYQTETVMVDLDEEEWEIYNEARAQYRGFCKKEGISLGGQNGWKRFIIATSKSDEGRKAFAAWRTQRKIALATPRKLLVLRDLLRQHNEDRVLVFTNDNATVYTISKEFLIPAITHQTKTKERHETLSRFNSGVYPIIVTSKVLNEGVNVPEANIAVVLSGSGTVREHVQRLGRILRKVGDKTAILYEVVARGTSEESISDRRRQHDAYR
ncbi:MAG: DEAD/DEAH box helicase, partial [Planctomycetota bacterium]|nr:DEAD/DEAH box helicase [Planctomycetota bacterium]